MAEVRPQVTLSQYLIDRRGDPRTTPGGFDRPQDEMVKLQAAYEARIQAALAKQPALGQGVGLNAQVGNPTRPSLAEYIKRQGTGNRAVNPQRTGRIGYNEELHGAVLRNAGYGNNVGGRPNPQDNPALKTAVGAPATVSGRSNQQIAADRAKRLRERRAQQAPKVDASLARKMNRIF